MAKFLIVNLDEMKVLDMDGVVKHLGYVGPESLSEFTEPVEMMMLFALLGYSSPNRAADADVFLHMAKLKVGDWCGDRIAVVNTEEEPDHIALEEKWESVIVVPPEWDKKVQKFIQYHAVVLKATGKGEGDE